MNKLSNYLITLVCLSLPLIQVNSQIAPGGYAGGYSYAPYGGTGELEVLVAKLIQAKLLALSSLRGGYPIGGGYPVGGGGYPVGGGGYPIGGGGYPVGGGGYPPYPVGPGYPGGYPVGGGYPPYPVGGFGGGYPPYYDRQQSAGPVGGYPGAYAGTGYRPGLSPFNSPIRR